jgi:two-component system nitrogen regulation response regulator GlnG
VSQILVVDDEQAVCWALERALRGEGHRVDVAPSAEAALRLAQAHRPDAIILDVRLPGMDGLSALERLRQLSDDAPVIVVTAFGNLATAVRAVEGGAFDYLAKPFDLDHALITVGRALQRRAAQQTPTQPAEPLGPPEEIVGTSAAMQAVYKRIALVAPAARVRSWSHVPCTVTAAAATGRSCRSTSRRSIRDWSKANCSAT